MLGKSVAQLVGDRGACGGVDRHARRDGGVRAVVEVGLGEPRPEQRPEITKNGDPPKRSSCPYIPATRTSICPAREPERHAIAERQAVQARLLVEHEHRRRRRCRRRDPPASAGRPRRRARCPSTPTTRSSSSPVVVIGRTDPNRKPTASSTSGSAADAGDDLGREAGELVRVDHEVGPQVVVRRADRRLRRLAEDRHHLHEREADHERARGGRGPAWVPHGVPARDRAGHAGGGADRQPRTRRASGRANVASSTITPKNTSSAPTPTTRNAERTSSALCDWAMPTRRTGTPDRDQRAPDERRAGGT